MCVGLTVPALRGSWIAPGPNSNNNSSNILLPALLVLGVLVAGGEVLKLNLDFIGIRTWHGYCRHENNWHNLCAPPSLSLYLSLAGWLGKCTQFNEFN